MKSIFVPFLNQNINLDKWVKEIILWHFDPLTGSKYWLNKERELGINAIKEINTYSDLRIFGLFPEEDLYYIPIEDFIPRGYLKNGDRPRIFESGGTIGKPKRIIDVQYREKIAQWLNYSLDLHKFPKKGNWLHIAPTGPHVIGYTTGLLANLRQGLCYYIDFDSRWIKICIKERRDDILQMYLEHIVLQSLDILNNQSIKFIFTTPKTIEVLSKRVNLNKLNLEGIVYGGTHVSPDVYKFFKEELLKDIPFLIVYGNTLMGVAPQSLSQESNDCNLYYYGCYPYFITEVVSPENPQEQVEYGKWGRIKITSLNKDFFIPNLLERDEAIRIPPNEIFSWDGVCNVRPFSQIAEKIIEGVY